MFCNRFLAHAGFFREWGNIEQLVFVLASTACDGQLVLAGLWPLIKTLPMNLLFSNLFGGTWLLWVGWQMAHVSDAQESRSHQSMTFLAALLFQFPNPKAIFAKLALPGLLYVAEASYPGAIG